MICTYIVDQSAGPFHSIQEAINAAHPGGIIRINPGLYFENLVISKEKLTIIPNEDSADIIVISVKNPTITINLQKDQQCTIIGLKLSHCGNSDEAYLFQFRENIEKFFETQNDFEQKPNLFLQKVKKNIKIMEHDAYNLVSLYPIKPQMNCVIFIKQGLLIIKQCYVSLNFILKRYKQIIFGIVCDEGSQLDMSYCELKGSKLKQTVGVLAKWADVKIQTSYIHLNQLGGILIQSHKLNKITLSKIKYNGQVGINCSGVEAQQKLVQNSIDSNDGYGILINVGNQAKIIRNEIQQNKVGIKSVSANPFILQNKIEQNLQDGIYTMCEENYHQFGMIYKNKIIGNGNNGIYCEGQYNLTKIKSNQFIGLNNKAGIKVGAGCYVNISDNVISQNCNFIILATQGILLVETSAAIIQNNQILKNIKANIALGGLNSGNTFIFNNTISQGLSEGIFIIKSEDTKIQQNSILENNDGIVCYQSHARIQSNKLMNNKSNGIIILKNSYIHVLDNEIKDNDGIGIFLRDNSSGKIQGNEINLNEIDFAIEKNNPKLHDFKEQNTLQGNIVFPKVDRCIIF